jgi:hypothetical protein
MSPKPAQTTAAASWRDSGQGCIYSDSHRHLGHVIQSADGWLAFDGTRTNAQGNAFRPLGSFHSAEAAKEAVQAAAKPRIPAEPRL